VKKTSTPLKAAAAGALLIAGLGAGVALGAAGSASADATASQGTRGYQSSQGGQAPDPTKSMRSDEKLLTGTTASKVRAAALAKYPKATIQRVETDSDGVYEAHIVTAAGQELIVQVGKDFAVTGTDSRGGHGGDHDGDHDGPPTTQQGSGA
jgi:hypothetical protein